MTKKTYEAPKLEELGSFEAMTKGGTSGTRFDANFQNDAPVPFNENGEPIIFS